MIEVRFHRGIEVPGHGLWLDPWDPKPLAFVSHAHSDHTAPHARILASLGTARLMQARLGSARPEHLLEFGRTTELCGAQITLLPAGHIFGSAQLHLEAEAGSLLYTGDFKLRPGLSAEPAEWRHAGTLIMETTYGRPRYCMPPTAEVIAQMLAFCQEALEDGGVPVLLGYSLGKSQEILCALLQAGLTPMLHGAVFRMTEIYRRLRPGFPGGYERYEAGRVAGKVLVCPPSANQSVMLKRIKNRRTAVLTGWALDPGAKFRFQCDAAFPLTDHADYPDLLRYVELVQPRQVLTLHGFAAEFAADLRERGIDAWALSDVNQLELKLPWISREPQIRGAARSANPPGETSAVEPCSFLGFAALGEQIAAAPGKLKKTEFLQNYFRALDAESLPMAATYLTGRAFPQHDPRVLHAGWAIISRALLAVSQIGEQRFHEISRRHSDAGRTAYEVLLECTSPQPFTLVESLGFFDALHRARGPLAKTELLQQRLSALTALEASYVVKILTSDLRIGLKEGLVEEAIAAAFEASLEEVREANMLLGDIGETALLASRRALEQASLRLFRPIKCMLASPEPTAQAVWGRLVAASGSQQPEESGNRLETLPDPALSPPAAAPPLFWIEDKYDGIRAQLHVGGGRVEIFTRDLRNVSSQFADLARAARQLSHEVILDGELLAFEAGRKLTFFDLQKRLGRTTEDDLFLGRNDVPVVFRAFDLLWLDGVSLLKKPLHQRRAGLEALAFPPGLEIAPTRRVGSVEEIEATFSA
ncbi:MAG: DNA ligase, partial [Verrucomicrobiota bacterium]|nr:DNA ligase [Verrucomicrobiota bacterium]